MLKLFIICILTSLHPSLIKDEQNAAKMKKDFYGGMSYLIFSQTPKH